MKTSSFLKSKETLWQDLENAAKLLRQQRLSDLFKSDPQRAAHFSLKVDDLYLDYSKNFLTQEIMGLLFELAHARLLPQAIEQLLKGEKINTTENRPALHTALRKDLHQTLIVDNQDIIPLIKNEKEKMFKMVETLQAGKWLGVSGKPIKHIVNLGIGGSDLGPLMAVHALASYQQGALKLHFVSNIDPAVIFDIFQQLDPETTLFIISSKSFSTPETLINARLAKQWLKEKLNTEQLTQHFIAVTANPAKAQAFGMATDHILQFAEWVGGRYSIWSTIGLPLALSIGVEHFEAFLAGARAMDEHFEKAPLAENMPVLLALIGIWYINFWQAPTLAVLPYTQYLRFLPDYLQQLDMESNGKKVQRDGQAVSYETGPIVWGQVGTNGQHAFYQLLHQGTHFIPIDFIALAQSNTPFAEQHQQLLAHCLAQSAALMQGSEDSILPNEQMPGNKPSNTLLLSKMTPYVLGQLLALYEHKVFVQGVIWGINSFDQPGVELGKKLAPIFFEHLTSQTVKETLDPSSQRLIQEVRKQNSN